MGKTDIISNSKFRNVNPGDDCSVASEVVIREESVVIGAVEVFIVVAGSGITTVNQIVRDLPILPDVSLAKTTT